MKLEDDHQGGLAFPVSKETLKTEMGKSTHLAICAKKNLQKTRCLRFTMDGLLAAAMSLCTNTNTN